MCTHISGVLYSGARILVPPFSLWQNSSSMWRPGYGEAPVGQTHMSIHECVEHTLKNNQRIVSKCYKIIRYQIVIFVAGLSHWTVFLLFPPLPVYILSKSSYPKRISPTAECRRTTRHFGWWTLCQRWTLETSTSEEGGPVSQSDQRSRVTKDHWWQKTTVAQKSILWRNNVTWCCLIFPKCKQ